MNELLLQKAAVVRDETLENENSAYRIGTLFVDIINKIGEVVSTEQAKVDTLKFSANDKSLILSFDFRDNANVIHTKKVTIPVLTEKAAGILLPEHLSNLNNKIKKITPVLISKAEFEAMKEKDPESIYYVYEEE